MRLWVGRAQQLGECRDGRPCSWAHPAENLGRSDPQRLMLTQHLAECGNDGFICRINPRQDFQGTGAVGMTALSDRLKQNRERRWEIFSHLNQSHRRFHSQSGLTGTQLFREGRDSSLRHRPDAAQGPRCLQLKDHLLAGDRVATRAISARASIAVELRGST